MPSPPHGGDKPKPDMRSIFRPSFDPPSILRTTINSSLSWRAACERGSTSFLIDVRSVPVVGRIA
jgi:hypothetical protein